MSSLYAGLIYWSLTLALATGKSNPTVLFSCLRFSDPDELYRGPTRLSGGRTFPRLPLAGNDCTRSPLPISLPWLDSESEDTARHSLPTAFPRVVAANRGVLEALAANHEQGIATRPLDIEKLFAAATY
jgi:hypothetical protein